jgi:protein-S-isoprenylcysteine O-methyltransferase Ste14
MKVRKLNKSYHIYGRFPQMKRQKAVLVIVLTIVFQTAQAEGVVSSDFISSMGKIYVVAGVCLVILIALFVYMYQLDRKISRLEKRYKNE